MIELKDYRHLPLRLLYDYSNTHIAIFLLPPLLTSSCTSTSKNKREPPLPPGLTCAISELRLRTVCSSQHKNKCSNEALLVSKLAYHFCCRSANTRAPTVSILVIFVDKLRMKLTVGGALTYAR